MFELTETERLAEQAVRSWCEKVLAPAIPALETGETLPYDLLHQLGSDLGVSAPLVAAAERRIIKLRARPERDAPPPPPGDDAAASGGFGDDPMLTAVLLKEIARISPGFALSLISTLGCALTVLARGGAGLIERCVLPLLRFERIGAWALTEPEAGSDAFGGMRTRAMVVGDQIVLNGQKIFITNAPYADVFTVYARLQTDAGECTRSIVVERGTQGLHTGRPMRKMGMHDSPTGEISLHDCHVPVENVLGTLEPSAGPRGEAALSTLNIERAVMPAICLGIIERCVDESAAYAGTRRQFGQPIGEFQGVSFKLARMEVARENARNLVAKLAWAQREGKLDARLASVAKLYCAEHATQVALDAIQIHGGAGYMAELPFEKLMRDAKLFEIGGGTNEIQLQTIARALLSERARVAAFSS